MLDEKTIGIIKSTVPVLKEHGVTLTTHFYKRLFEHNPGVIPLFNEEDQKSGAQAKKLAQAILSYAKHIDNLGALTGAVEKIAARHTSALVKEEHYPIVGEHLLASIKEVVGDAATDELIEAWGKAYWVLANILIEKEKQIYNSKDA